jgi:sporulation protein YlmC with PRC-barrel domain
MDPTDWRTGTTLPPTGQGFGFDEIHLADIKGRRVIGNHGTTLGTIEDAAIDPKTWRVSGFVVALKRDVTDRLDVAPRHRGGGLFEQGGPRIQIGADRVQTFGENVILNVDAEQIASTLRAAAPADEDVDYVDEGRRPL